MIYYKAEFIWERLERGKWEKYIWYMNRPSEDSWYSSEDTFDNLTQIKLDARKYNKEIKERYGKNARFVAVEVTKYITSKIAFMTLHSIKDTGNKDED